MRKAGPKGSRRQSRRASETEPTGLPMTSRKDRTQRPADVASGKPRGKSVARATGPVTKPKQPDPKSTAVGKGSRASGGKRRAVAHSSLRDVRRQLEIPTPEVRENAAIAVDPKGASPLNLQSKRSSKPDNDSAPATGIEQHRAQLLALLQPRTTPQRPSAFSIAIRANAEIHRAMSSRAVAAFRFAANMTRCRTPLDFWRAQLQFASDLWRSQTSAPPTPLR